MEDKEIAEKPWQEESLGEPRRIETGIAGVECVECDRFRFFHVDGDQYLAPGGKTKQVDVDRLYAAVRPLMEEPGEKVWYMKGIRISLQDFLEKSPPAEMIDGVVAGDSIVVEREDGPRKVTDHHGEHRATAESASMQCYLEELERTDDEFVDAQGRHNRNLVINHADLDSLFSIIARIYGEKIRNGEGGKRVRELFRRENIMDKFGAATFDVSIPEIAELNGIQPADPPADAPEQAMEQFRVISECFERFQDAVLGRGRSIELNLEYAVLQQHHDWAVVWEAAPVARKAMLEDKQKFALILKGDRPEEAAPAREILSMTEKDAEREEAMREYTVQKLDIKNSKIKLGKGMFGFLNYLNAIQAGQIEGVDPDVVRSESGVLSWLKTLCARKSELKHAGEREQYFAQFKGAFGGSDTIGGGKSTIDWRIMSAGLSWYIAEELRKPKKASIPAEHTRVRNRMLTVMRLKDAA